MKKLLGSLLMVLILSGCSRPCLLPRDEDGEVAAQRRRWEAQNLNDYRFRFSRTCFCYELGQVIVEVRNDRVVAVRDAETGATVPATARTASPRSRGSWTRSPRRPEREPTWR